MEFSKHKDGGKKLQADAAERKIDMLCMHAALAGTEDHHVSQRSPVLISHTLVELTKLAGKEAASLGVVGHSSPSQLGEKLPIQILNSDHIICRFLFIIRRFLLLLDIGKRPRNEEKSKEDQKCFRSRHFFFLKTVGESAGLRQAILPSRKNAERLHSWQFLASTTPRTKASASLLSLLLPSLFLFFCNGSLSLGPCSFKKVIFLSRL